ncbi:hypothetical protein P2T68_16955 [Pseudomonas sp. G11]|uniref:hypothetical protein n=1 Tax=Pseudomonas sp. G11 TaxID=528343 RepID=UPI0024029D1D|nr:hypothetical protein [Pseudomonas sp. G11]WEX18934.1 hypothetical protein P2T68_16955 [Pseudomonas sp. G11]
MNAKKCKAIRQLLKLEGVDVKETAYVGTSARDKFGRDRIKHLSVAPCQLKSCGRSRLQDAKRAA